MQEFCKQPSLDLGRRSPVDVECMRCRGAVLAEVEDEAWEAETETRALREQPACGPICRHVVSISREPDVLDKASLPKVEMLNRKGFVPYPGASRQFFH